MLMATAETGDERQDTARMAGNAARNRQRLLELFGGLDDITWGRRIGHDRRWAIQHLLAHLVNEEERMAAWIGDPAHADTPEKGGVYRRALIAPFRPKALRAPEDAEVDRLRLTPVPVLLERYAALSATRVALMQQCRDGKREEGDDAGQGMERGLEAMWLDQTLHEADLRRAIRARPLVKLVEDAEAHDLIGTAVRLLPELFRSEGRAGQGVRIYVGCTGPGRGLWQTQLGGEGKARRADEEGRAAELRLDCSFATAIEVLTGERSLGRAVLSGAVRVSGRRPIRACLRLWRLRRGGGA